MEPNRALDKACNPIGGPASADAATGELNNAILLGGELIGLGSISWESNLQRRFGGH